MGKGKGRCTISSGVNFMFVKWTRNDKKTQTKLTETIKPKAREGYGVLAGIKAFFACEFVKALMSALVLK